MMHVAIRAPGKALLDEHYRQQSDGRCQTQQSGHIFHGSQYSAAHMDMYLRLNAEREGPGLKPLG
jgi:hypothetical protein